jgi:hypothetical protein
LPTALREVTGGSKVDYEGKKVRLSRKVTEHEGRPQIKIASPEQIAVVP